MMFKHLDRIIFSFDKSIKATIVVLMKQQS